MDEEMILPDDFNADQPLSDETTAESTETPVETESQPQETETAEATEAPQQQFLKVQFNREEKEIPLDEAIPLVQKGMNYDKVQERLTSLEQEKELAYQQARDAFIAEQGYEWQGHKITTEAEYKQALQEQQLLEKYQDRDLPQEVIDELLENRRFREESKRKDQEQQEKQKQQEKEKQEQKQFLDFFDYYKQLNGKDFDAEKDQLPPEVWEAYNNGTPLKFAYMEHYNNELRQQLQVQKQNEENQKKAPVHGGVTEHGSTETQSTDPFLIGFNSI